MQPHFHCLNKLSLQFATFPKEMYEKKLKEWLAQGSLGRRVTLPPGINGP